jgi:hypothetical protein
MFRWHRLAVCVALVIGSVAGWFAEPLFYRW